MLGPPVVALSISSSTRFDDDIAGKGEGDDEDEYATTSDAVVDAEDGRGCSTTMMMPRHDHDDECTPTASTVVPSASMSASLCRGGRHLPPLGGIYISMPLRYASASPLIIDDGTPRIIMATSNVCILHTGITSDGRALCDYATSTCIEYEYTYGEEMDYMELLRVLSDKMREMTTKAGSRPYGCALLVGCLGNDDIRDRGRYNGRGRGRGSASKDAAAAMGPTLYRVDPSGAVVLLNPYDGGEGGISGGGSIEDNHDAACAIDNLDAGTNYREASSSMGYDRYRRRGSAAFLGNWDTIHRNENDTDNTRRRLVDRRYTTEGDVRDALTDVTRRTFVVDDDEALGVEEGGEGRYASFGDGNARRGRTKRPILYASFTRERGLRVYRVMSEEE
jgi:hypothetical protein